MQTWRVLDDFVCFANRIREIFDSDSKSGPKRLGIQEIIQLARKDELFLFALKLLIEEFKCKEGQAALIDKFVDNELPHLNGFVTIENWLNQSLAGLIRNSYPIIELLLKKQKVFSVYLEFEFIFGATKLLNKLICEHFNPNVSGNQISLTGEETELFRSFHEPLKAVLIETFNFVLPKLEEDAFASGPSFKYELERNYLDFETKSEFKSIPVELLEVHDGSDDGNPFGKRWARRLVAKASAYAKINLNLMSIGSFPSPLPVSLDSMNSLNFDVQLPESVGIDLLHHNAFDNSMLSSEFLEYSAFSVHFARFLHEIPFILEGKQLKNTDIFSHAPVLRSSINGSKASLASFRALLLASGIHGHLTMEALPPVDIHEILNFDSAETSACLLLALALSNKKESKNNYNAKFLDKLFSMHLANFQSSLNLEVPPILQLSAALSLGIFKFRSFDRGSSQLLLKEIFRPSPLNVNHKAIDDSPLASIVPGITLGMCLMAAKASKDSNDFQFALDIQNQLNSTAAANVQQRIAVLIASALINFDNPEYYKSTNNLLPWSRSLPDLLDKEESLIFWCQLTWKLSQWSQIKNESIQDQGNDKIKLKFDEIFDSVCVPAVDSVWTDSAELGLLAYACQCLMANSCFLALKYAGAGKIDESTLLDHWIKKLATYQIIHNTDPDYFLIKIQSYILTTYQYLLLCKSVIYSGSADESCWSRLRELMGDPLLFKFGNGRLFYSSFGFLFSGKGRLCVKTTRESGQIDYFALICLLCTLMPIFPASPVDAELEFVTLMDTLWPFAMKCK